MSNEKLIKKQARDALKGNIAVLIAGMAAVSLMMILIENIYYLPMLATGMIDLETEMIADGRELYANLIFSAAITVGVLVSPLLNGFLKAAANTAVKRNCEITDLFFYFKGFRRYLRTLVVNMVLALMFSALTYWNDWIYNDVSDKFGEGDFGWLIVAAMWIVFLIWKILIYLWFEYYPLAAYALDDSKPLPQYLFGYIGFSFACFGKTLKLFFSLIGWMALCFFVVPILYVGPYVSVAALNSARWLLEMRKK